jgi:uncharacterized membrane-anchored protein
MTAEHTLVSPARLLSKVPEVTIYFWVIKVLCVTVGETAADYLNVSLNVGLTATSVAVGVLLVIALIMQFRASQYVAGIYWVTVTLVSVFGTLVTDNLTDNLGVPLEASTLIFAALLAVTFLAWYVSEKTLSIHSIITSRREAFYWAAVGFTFALGTASGDLMAQVLGLGYVLTGLIVAALITTAALGWRFGLHPVLAFWVIYVLTRPLGASIGDLLSQSATEGGLGWGYTTTSLIFLAAILVIVVYLSVTKADVIPRADDPDHAVTRGGLWQTVIVVALVVVAASVGYTARKAALAQDTPAAAPGAQPAAAGSRVSPLGDLSAFRTITQDTLNLLNNGDQSGATARVSDLETEWDNAQARLKPKDTAAWTTIDGKIDTVLRELRATNPTPEREKTALTTLLAALR